MLETKLIASQLLKNMFEFWGFGKSPNEYTFAEEIVFPERCFYCIHLLQVVYDDLVLYVSAKSENDRKEWVEAIQDGM